MKPLSLLVVDTTPASPLSTPIPTRSTGHISRARQRCPWCPTDAAKGSLRSLRLGRNALSKARFPT